MVAAGLGAHIVPLPVANYLTHEGVTYVHLQDAGLAPFRVCVSDGPESSITGWFLGLVDEFSLRNRQE